MERNIGKIGICVLVIVMFLATTVTVNASIPDEYEVIWERDYIDGYANCRVAIDSNDNVIVCGVDQDYKGLVLKYNKDGDLIWSNHTSKKVYCQDSVCKSHLRSVMPTRIGEILTEGIIGSFLDIAVDSNDNIIVAGSFLNLDMNYGVICIKKYDPDGNEIWAKTYLPFLYSLVMGIDVDSNNDIFITGWGGIILPKGFVTKLRGSTGQKLWQCTRTIWGKLTVYNSVVVDSSDDAIAVGSIIEYDIKDCDIMIKDYDVMITKFGGKFGCVQRELVRETDALPCKIVMDQQGNFVAVGVVEDNIQTHYLLKFNSNFAVLWETIGVTEGFLYDAVIMNNGDIAVAGTKADINEYYAAIYDKNTGNGRLDMFLGECIATNLIDKMNDYMKGVAVDSAGDLYIVGACPVSKTIKVHVTGIGTMPIGRGNLSLLEFLKFHILNFRNLIS